jgi:hypothetical protein
MLMVKKASAIVQLVKHRAKTADVATSVLP